MPASRICLRTGSDVVPIVEIVLSMTWTLLPFLKDSIDLCLGVNGQILSNEVQFIVRFVQLVIRHGLTQR